MGSIASKRFIDLMVFVDQLQKIHGKLQSGQGRRKGQDALHRAGVVMVIAAWEAYIEALVTEAHEHIVKAGGADLPASDPASPPIWSKHILRGQRIGLKKDVSKLHTPHWQNVQRLFVDWIGVDPTNNWSWSSRGIAEWTPKKLRTYHDQWLRVRHCVAHGADLPTDVPFLMKNGKARLILWHLNECRWTFSHLVTKTDEAVADYLVNQYGIAKPW